MIILGKQVSIYLDKSLLEELEKVQKETKRSRSYLINEIVNKALKDSLKLEEETKHD